MKYYISETIFDETRNRTAASKAREDVNEIVSKNGYKALEVQYDYHLRKMKGFFPALLQLTKQWDTALNKIGKNDTVLIQFPLNHHPLMIPSKIDSIHKRGGKVIILIHDIDSLRADKSSIIKKLKYRKIKYEDNSILQRGDAIISHNDLMTDKIVELGIDRTRIVSLGLFDYLLHSHVNQGKRDINDPVIIAGTLRKGKADYAYELPQDIQFNLYGVGYEDEKKENITYYGSFPPEDLVHSMKGSFGLVWDGESSLTCQGVTGDYLRINNPHKTSLYIASCIPVIVWEESAIAQFVKRFECGTTIGSLSDLKSAISKIGPDEYQKMIKNTITLSGKISEGYFTENALRSAECIVGKMKI